jgi:hypothetical protein
MRTIFILSSLILGLCLALAVPASALDRQETKYQAVQRAASDYQLAYARNQLNGESAPSAGFGTGPLVVVMVPEYHFVDHGALVGNVGDNTFLQSRSGSSHTASFTFTATKPLTDVISLGFFYQYVYGSYSSGLTVPVDIPGVADFDGTSKVHVNAHVVGVLANFNLGNFGRLETSLLQAFDTYGGSETVITNGTPDTRSADGFSDRVSSLMAWWIKDIPINETLTLSPYLSWRTVYVVLVGQNDWQSTVPGTKLGNSHAWAHLASGGLKATWTSGLWTVTGRLGANYRVSKADVPGFSSRAVAPGVAHLGWHTSWDRTIATAALGVGYVIPESCILDLSYNGFLGADTNAHSLSFAAIFPF